MTTKIRKTRKTRIPIGNILLAVIATSGILSIAVVAPNAIQALKVFGYGNRKKFPKHYFNNALSRLIKRGLIEFKETENGKLLRLTPEGKRILNSKNPTTIKPFNNKLWDKKWHIVIFDIKEKKRGIRDKLRRELISQNFIKLQNSVWVSPYDCEEWIIMLKADFKIGKEILYIKAEKIENDKFLKKFFGLNGLSGLS